MSLFAPAGGSGASAAAPVSDHVVEFKAGKMEVRGSTVTALPAKGVVYLKRDQGFVNWFWRNRTTGAEDQPIMCFSGDQTFRRCKSAPASSRVFYLQFPNRREFYWMQDSDASKDDEIVAKANNVLNGTPIHIPQRSAAIVAQTPLARAEPMAVDTPLTPAVAPTASAPPAAPQRVPSSSAAAAAAPASSVSAPAVSATPAPITPAPAPATPAPAPAAAHAAPAQQGGVPAFDADMMRSIMAGLAQEMQQQQGHRNDADLTHILTAENIEPLLSHPDVVEALYAHLPEGAERSIASLRENIRSPQFTQALGSFSHALQTGQLDAVMGQFGVNQAVVNAHNGGTTGLCEAIQKQEDNNKQGGAGN